MIRFFLENGADVITGAPFAVAFREKIRTALRSYVEKAHPELASGLQEQADRALRHFCNEGDLKWISLLLWAGANPRSRGPDLDDRWADDPYLFKVNPHLWPAETAILSCMLVPALNGRGYPSTGSEAHTAQFWAESLVCFYSSRYTGAGDRC
jgi:hypothetical protein